MIFKAASVKIKQRKSVDDSAPSKKKKKKKTRRIYAITLKAKALTDWF